MLRLILALGAALAITQAATAQEGRRPSHCIAVAENTPGLRFAGSTTPDRLWQANWTEPLADYTVRIHYIAHASFLIQTPEGMTAVTDYTGPLGNTDLVPDVVTMNHAHGSHWTMSPDPRIPNVLRGWNEEQFGTPADHYIDLGGMLVRNVSTDIRSSFGGTEENGNSIFVFETAGLCIGHLGHLHHEPNEEQYAALGRLDVVMVPVDGGYTMNRTNMINVIERLRSSVIIPMHWFSGYALTQFLDEIGTTFAVEQTGQPSLEVSLRDLPPRPTIMVLQPRYLSDATD